MMKKLLIFNPMSPYGAKALWRMIKFGSVSLCYKGSWAHCSYNQIVVSPGNQQWEVQIANQDPRVIL
jgi:hypothetical protein